MSKKLSFENTRRLIERGIKEQSFLNDLVFRGIRESEEQARKEINKLIYDLAEKNGVSIYEICFHFTPEVKPKPFAINKLGEEFMLEVTTEYEIRLEPIEFELEKGPGYWKDKYLRIKEKMQAVIDEKEG